MARPSNTDQRRDEIAQGLGDVMVEHGFRGASISKIAAASQLSPGLVHYHFSSKREILLHLVSQVAERWTTRIEAMSLPDEPPRERLRATIEATLGLGAGSDLRSARLWTTLGAEAGRSADVREAMAPVLTALLHRLEQDLHAAGVADAPLAARGLLAALEGTWRLATLGLVPPGEGAPAVLRLLDALLER